MITPTHEPTRGRWDRMSVVEQFDYTVGLEAEIRRLRQGLWDVAAAAGADQDGDRTPDHLSYPDIVEYALQEVRQLREDYDSCDVCFEQEQPSATVLNNRPEPSDHARPLTREDQGEAVGSGDKGHHAGTGKPGTFSSASRKERNDDR